ncbi:SPOR domain-containing protein [uncultured Enterovirga sp.]|uniref:SPOR domain-containing protein n=1 Tax=uncultured Enterovirga sp. TaxID=2026352 RepID=UPI0035CA8350
MLFSCVGVGWMRVAVLASLTAFLAGLFAPTEAEARRKGGKQAKRSSAAVTRNAYAPPFAAMVVDARTGRTMYGIAEDELRHPASVTKVMTLYLLFEQIERGTMQLNTELKVSREAASMAPSKLGLRPGETIEVEDAIKAIVTKSANDVAAVIAENIAGTEEAFAERMTRKARQLGMSRTVYRNASGLPDRAQVTTARDLTILGRAIQERFPRLYKYFQTRSFEYADRVIGNHNRLLGRVEGVDGIKTGFTNASGFNLLTSARLEGRHVVGVVLGGRSGASRDATMANLIRTNLARASTSGSASIFADSTDKAEGVETDRTQVASADEEVQTTASTSVEEKPRRAANLNAMRPLSVVPAPIPPSAPATRAVASAVTSDPAPRASVPPLPANSAKIDSRLPAMSAVPIAREPQGRVETTGSIAARPTQPAIRAVTPEPVREAASAAATKPIQTSPWVIQLAAEDNEAKARELLDEAKSRTGRALSKAAPFTEKVTRGGATLYRARFSGFAEADAAQEACKTLKSRGYACFATRS